MATGFLPSQQGGRAEISLLEPSHAISDSPLSADFATNDPMKITILSLALIAIASSTLVSCTTNDGYPPRGMHNNDPMPAAVRRHQERMRR